MCGKKPKKLTTKNSSGKTDDRIYCVLSRSAKYELRANGAEMTHENPSSSASCFHPSNFAGGTYSTTSREFFDGLRYWPIVILSQPTLRKSFRTWQISASVSPSPSMIDDFVLMSP